MILELIPGASFKKRSGAGGEIGWLHSLFKTETLLPKRTHLIIYDYTTTHCILHIKSAHYWGIHSVRRDSKSCLINERASLPTRLFLFCYLVMQIHHDGALLGQVSSRVKHAAWCAGVVVLSGLIYRNVLVMLGEKQMMEVLILDQGTDQYRSVSSPPLVSLWWAVTSYRNK